MPLFATIERDSPQHVKLITLAHLAADFKDKRTAEPHKELRVILYGYLTTVAASDAIKEEIERGLMSKSLAEVTKTLTGYGVPIDKLYVGDMIFSGEKARKIDIFLLQQGESAKDLPRNPPAPGGNTPNFPKPVKDAELTLSTKQFALEVTVYEVKSGRKTLIPDLKLKSITGVSPTEISTAFKAELKLWKPKLEGLLRKIGQQGIADKIEFSIKLIGGGSKSKEFAQKISVEVAASLKASLTFKITVPGTRRELPIELSYSYSGKYSADEGAYTDGRFKEEGKGMISVTLFRFNSW